MVTKKSLKAQIDFLIDRLQFQQATNKEFYEKIEKLSEENKNLKQKVTEMSEKVEFVYRKTDSLTVPQGTLFDEWMNGAQKEGEN